MIEVAFTSSFRRAFRRRIRGRAELEERFRSRLERFKVDPFDPQLRTHKLTGPLHDLWSFTLDREHRVVFAFAESGRALFVDVGTHDEVY